MSYEGWTGLISVRIGTGLPLANTAMNIGVPKGRELLDQTI
jgi:hypothetical protein